MIPTMVPTLVSNISSVHLPSPDGFERQRKITCNHRVILFCLQWWVSSTHTQREREIEGGIYYIRRRWNKHAARAESESKQEMWELVYTTHISRGHTTVSPQGLLRNNHSVYIHDILYSIFLLTNNLCSLGNVKPRINYISTVYTYITYNIIWRRIIIQYYLRYAVATDNEINACSYKCIEHYPPVASWPK